MNRLISLFTIYICVVFSNVAYSNPSTTPSTQIPKALKHTDLPIKIDQDNLEKILLTPLKTRANTLAKLKNDNVALFDKLTAPKMVQQHVYLEYILRFAINSNLNLSNLTKVDLTQTEDKAYTTKLSNSPHFAGPSLLFAPLPRHSNEKLEQALLAKGFPSKDLPILVNAFRQQLHKFSSHYEDKQLTEQVTQQIAKTISNKHNIPMDEYHRLFRYLSYVDDYQYQFYLNTRGLAIIEQLPEHSQRIVKSYLIEKLTTQLKLKAKPADWLNRRITAIEKRFKTKAQDFGPADLRELMIEEKYKRLRNGL